ncbi:hypothetical protein M405DRAFT_633193 [Rhizopogon salebrosus TDB-379]|nr:hypothetical protein M405DRAFT_633193 [Rhizopogon salebrosus TDB-379]
MANFNTTPTYTLHITDRIDISVDFSKSGKNVPSAEARIGNSKEQIKQLVGKTLSQTFAPPMKLSFQDSFNLHLLYKRRVMNNTVIGVHFDVEHIFRRYRELGGPYRQEYHTSHKKINIVLGLSGNSSTDGKPNLAPTTGNSSNDGTPDLVPTTDHIFRICPQFRILLIGKVSCVASSHAGFDTAPNRQVSASHR